MSEHSAQSFPDAVADSDGWPVKPMTTWARKMVETNTRHSLVLCHLSSFAWGAYRFSNLVCW